MMDAPHLFLVDDDPDDRELFCQALGIIAAAITCDTAADGEDALQQIALPAFRLPSLIFLDINMPKMSGRQLLNAIKEIESLRRVPVIMYSTSSVPEEKARLMAAGAAGFLVKEHSFDGLCGQLRTALQQHGVL